MVHLVYWYGLTGGCITVIVAYALIRANGWGLPCELGKRLGYCVLYMVVWPLVVLYLAQQYTERKEGGAACSPPQP
jgi:hypothetical protein